MTGAKRRKRCKTSSVRILPRVNRLASWYMPITPREKEKGKIAAKEEKGPIIVETDGLEKGNPRSMSRGAITATARDTLQISVQPNSKARLYRIIILSIIN